MISLLCQKSEAGVISASEDKSSQIHLNDLLYGSAIRSLSSDFATATTSTNLPMSSMRTKSVQSAPISGQLKPSRIAKNRMNARSFVPLNEEKTTITNLNEDGFYQKHHMFRSLSSKKLKSIQKWINHKLSEDSANLDYYNNLNELLAKQQQLTQEINEDLKRCDEKQLRRKELLYKNWYINVYEPIQVEIAKNMSGSKAELVKYRRDLKYAEYLDKVNERGCLFQDDFESDEYDPINVLNIEAHLRKKLKDPTNVPQRKSFVEENMTSHGKVFTLRQIEKSKLPIIVNDNQTRANLTWNDWLLNQFSHVNSTARLKSAQKCKKNKMNSEWNFDYGNEDNESAWNRKLSGRINRDFNKQNKQHLIKT